MERKYYAIEEDSSKKITGKNNGGSQAEIIERKFRKKSSFDKFYENFVYVKKVNNTKEAIIHVETIHSLDFELEYVLLNKKAIYTPFISYIPNALFCRFLVSAQVIELLKSLQLPFYECYPAKVYQKGFDGFKDYHLLHVPPLPSENVVSFPDSKFFIRNYDFSFSDVSINTLDEYCELKDKDKSLFCKEVALIKEKVAHLDYFSISFLLYAYVSDSFFNKFNPISDLGIEFLLPGKRQYVPEIVFV